MTGENNVLRCRIKSKSFLFTILREPARRAISSFYFFKVGRDGVDPTEANLLRELRSVENFQLAKILTLRRDDTYAMTVPDAGGLEEEEKEKEDGNAKMTTTTANANAASSSNDLDGIIDRVLNEVDFLGTLERLDESLTLLAIILDLDISDVLYVPAKEGRSEYGQQKKAGASGNITANVRDYLDGEEWRRRNRGDVALYRAVDASIDRTIDAIGRERFRSALQILRRDDARVRRECDGPALERVPESQRACYWADSGCQYKCIDRLFPLSER